MKSEKFFQSKIFYILPEPTCLIRKTFIMFSFLVASFSLFSQTVTYYDKDWIECEKIKAVYKGTRTPLESNSGSIIGVTGFSYWILKDYYITGEIQMTGLEVLNPSINELLRHGDFIWYYKNGEMKQKAIYNYGRLVTLEKYPITNKKGQGKRRT